MTELIAVALIVVAAPAITGFVVWYGPTAPWWRSPTGRALFTASLALALLIDLSLIYYFIGADVPDAVTIVVHGLITAGCWLLFGALAHERYKRHKARR